jgi:hypothetical protein
MTDMEFRALLDRCREELAAKQALFTADCISSAPYHYDLNQGVLAVGSERYASSLVGTRSITNGTWLWGWANDSFSDSVRQAASRAKSLYDVTGFRVFIDPGVHASKQDAEDFTALTVHAIDAIGFWRYAGEDNEMYLAVERRLDP